ncbi:MAG: 4-hydroxybenzoate octaprenyltransferase, partial [Betaproteobacteria bacterium]|nr:4-hydroxybenzoate octaprenyltransferase [Betaproteobacteria bacterium]
RKTPQMPLMLQENFTVKLMDMLRSGEIDCAILAEPFPDTGLATAPLYDEPFMAALPLKHPLGKKKSITAEQLKNETMLLLGNGHCFRDHVLEVCPEFARFSSNAEGIRKSFEGSSLETIRHMVAAGMGVTLVPRLSVPEEALAAQPQRKKNEDLVVMRQKLALYLDLIRWNRPAGWLLLLWPTLAALWLAADGFPGWHLIAVFTLGTVLMRSAGCCLNDVADRDFDRHVKRTAERPVTSGRIGVKEALAVGAVLAMLAFALVLTLRVETVAWSFAALAVAIVYPFAKRFVAMPQAVLGVAFSFGIPMAYAAVTGDVPWQAWALLIGNLFWVLAYDTEYAMVDRDDDLKIGMKTSAITLGDWDVRAIMVFYAAYLAVWGVLLDAPHKPWVQVGLAAAAAQAAWHFVLIKDRTREGCFKAFRLNHWVGFAVFTGLALSSLMGA